MPNLTVIEVLGECQLLLARVEKELELDQPNLTIIDKLFVEHQNKLQAIFKLPRHILSEPDSTQLVKEYLSCLAAFHESCIKQHSQLEESLGSINRSKKVITAYIQNV